MDGYKSAGLWFPINLEKFRGIPINSHPGAFGCARKHNFHEGVDLYGEPGDWVYAIQTGFVVANAAFTGPLVGFGWWNNTDAVIIKDDNGYFVYGELKSTLQVGDMVASGAKVGELVPVLPENKKRDDIPEHSVTMLHLERYNNDYKIEMGWASWEQRDSRPYYLEDPTPFLINALTNRRREVNFLTL